ncbi:MAG TPA: hypothetical protein DEV93_15960 [Chloroflexi bacterium]|jgi:hypothetical protein|nr:hypothetical protein [Chloroflexota bacterium]
MDEAEREELRRQVREELVPAAIAALRRAARKGDKKAISELKNQGVDADAPATITVRFTDGSVSPLFTADDFRIAGDHIRFWADTDADGQQEVVAFSWKDVEVVLVVGTWTGQGQESLPAGIRLEMVPDTPG